MALSRAMAERELESLLADVVAGQQLSREFAEHLVTCPDSDLPLLLEAAQQLRDKHKGDIVSYSRKVFLPLTNLCRDYCGYCIFRRDPGQPGAHTMTPEEVLDVCRRGEELGCTEALFSLGDKPEAIFPETQDALRQLGYRSTLHYLEAMCELVLRETRLIPHANPGLMSYEWLRRLREVSPSLGLMLETTNVSIAAHADRTPDKLPSNRIGVIEDAGRLGIPFTTGILIGIGESPADRVEALFKLRHIQDEYGHIQEVIIQNFRAKPGIPMSNWPEPTQNDMLRTIAVARLILREMNVQAPPNLSALDYPRLLDAGINDWGGVSPLTPDFINPEAPWPHLVELRRQTEARGFTLKQRLPVYPQYLPTATDTASKTAARLREAADADGYAATTTFRNPANST
jgi:7,8-didemethyl-8-hydroxy-5-deazariboflavin synthase CofG subunit